MKHTSTPYLIFKQRMGHLDDGQQENSIIKNTIDEQKPQKEYKDHKTNFTERICHTSSLYTLVSISNVLKQKSQGSDAYTQLWAW